MGVIEPQDGTSQGCIWMKDDVVLIRKLFDWLVLTVFEPSLKIFHVVADPRHSWQTFLHGGNLRNHKPQEAMDTKLPHHFPIRVNHGDTAEAVLIEEGGSLGNCVTSFQGHRMRSHDAGASHGRTFYASPQKKHLLLFSFSGGVFRYSAYVAKETPKAMKITGSGAVRGAAVMAVWTFASRILGFVRDILMTTIFGLFDDFVMAWMVPNLFRRLFGEGAVHAAVQPALAQTRETQGEEAAHSLYARFHGFFLLLLILLVAIGEGILLFWQNQLPLGHEDLAALKLSALLLPYVLPICLTALAGAPQQLSGKFMPSAFAPILLNLTWIAVLLVLQNQHASPADAIFWLPPAILLGGILQWGVQQPSVRQCGWPVRPRFTRNDAEVRTTMLAFAPAVLGLAAVQVNLLVDQVLVRELAPSGANTHVFLANRLLQLPLALVGIAVATGAMPWFSRLSAEGRFEELSKSFLKSLESSLLLLLAAGAGLWVLAQPITSVLFQHGAFDAEQAQELSSTLRAYLWSLPAACMVGLFARVRQSRGDIKGAALAAAWVIPINLLLDWWWLPIYGAAGAGYATAVALWLQVFLLFLGLKKLQIHLRPTFSRMVRLPLPAISSTVCAGWTLSQMSPDMAFSVKGLAACIGAGILGAVGMMTLVLPDDFKAFRATLMQKFR